MKKQKTKLFKKWLFTYLFLSVVSLVFIYSIHTIYNQSMKDDLAEVNNVYLENVSGLFDNQFRAIDQLVYTIGLNADFNKITSFDKEITTELRYDIWELTDNLDLFARSSGLIEKISVYKKNPKIIIGESSAFYEPHLNLYTGFNFGINLAVFTDLMGITYNQKVIRVDDWYPLNQGGNSLIYLQTVPIQFKNTPRGTLIIQIDEKKLGNFSKNEFLPDSKLLVFNREQQLVYANDPSFYDANLDNNLFIDMTKRDITIDNTIFIKDTIETNSREWTYVSLVPKAIYYVRINKVRTIILLMTILFFLINILIAYYFTNMMYLPVNRLITSINTEEKMAAQSEFEFIENIVRKNALEKKQMKRDLFLQKKPLKNAFLSRLLRGSIREKAVIYHQFDKFDIQLKGQGYQVLLIEFDLDEQEDTNIGFSQFVIHNIFEEILSEYYVCYGVEVEARVAFILKVNDTDTTIKSLENQLDNALALIQNMFNWQCHIGISGIYNQDNGFAYAYQKSIEAILHAGMLDDRRIVYALELQGLSTQYEFSTEHEYRLSQYIQSGVLNQTLQIITEVIHKNMKNKLVKISYMKCLMFDLMSTIIKSMDDCDFDEMMEERDAINQMIRATNIEGMKSIIVDVAKIACEIKTASVQNVPKLQVRTEIDLYIHAHYADADLNVSRLGDIFNMTPTYLSKLYKKETGNSILHTINTVRLEASKKLLADSCLSINDIAINVGYVYSNAFIRFFKKQTGITPGQYKQLKYQEHS